jgi:hypothetical protein
MSTYTSLTKKYDGFVVPFYTIEVGGKKLDPSKVKVSAIRVDLSMGRLASGCRFRLYGIYDREARKFDAAVLGSVKVGVATVVSLGYGSSVTQVFTGYVAELRVHYGVNEQGVYAEVICLDARALMKDSYLLVTHKDKKPQALIEATLKNYSPLVSSVEVKAAELAQGIYLSQEGDDLSFVCDAALLRGLYFYIDCGKAYMGKAQADVCVEFDWEQCTVDLAYSYLNRKYTALGYDHNKMEPFTAAKPAKQRGSQNKTATVAVMLPLPSYYAGEAAGTIAQAAADRAVRESVSGIITCVGIPEPKLGKSLKLNKSPLGAVGISDTFTIVSVRHEMDDEGGYHTEIGIEGAA